MPSTNSGMYGCSWWGHGKSLGPEDQVMQRKRLKQPELVSLSIEGVENEHDIYVCIKTISCLLYHSLLTIITKFSFLKNRKLGMFEHLNPASIESKCSSFKQHLTWTSKYIICLNLYMLTHKDLSKKIKQNPNICRWSHFYGMVKILTWIEALALLNRNSALDLDSLCTLPLYSPVRPDVAVLWKVCSPSLARHLLIQYSGAGPLVSVPLLGSKLYNPPTHTHTNSRHNSDHSWAKSINSAARALSTVAANRETLLWLVCMCVNSPVMEPK